MKILDGVIINGEFWVFSGSLSNVAYDMTVRDTQTGAVKTYRNELGVFRSFGDVSGFPSSAAEVSP